MKSKQLPADIDISTLRLVKEPENGKAVWYIKDGVAKGRTLWSGRSDHVYNQLVKILIKVSSQQKQQIDVLTEKLAQLEETVVYSVPDDALDPLTEEVPVS